MWDAIVSAFFGFIGLIFKIRRQTHDQQMQQMGKLQQGNADLGAALQVEKNIAKAEAAAPKTEDELDKELKEGKA